MKENNICTQCPETCCVNQRVGRIKFRPKSMREVILDETIEECLKNEPFEMTEEEMLIRLAGALK